MTQRLPERLDLDITPFSYGDTYRAAEVRKAKSLMRYDQASFEKDWELAVALAFLMARPDNRVDWTAMLEDCFTRIYAYMANNPEELPFKKGTNHALVDAFRSDAV